MSHIFDLEPEFLKLHESCRNETMTSIERMYARYQATCHVRDREIPGDLVECGVWRGGSAMLMASTLLAHGRTDRTIWLYDTFDGVLPPGDDDVQEMSGRRAAEILAEQERTADNPFWGIAPRTQVEHNLQRTGYPMHRFHLVPGDVLATIPREGPEAISLLRLYTDSYASTSHVLQQLYPSLSAGGVLIVDDYGYWRGARTPTDEYFQSIERRPLLHRIDYTGRIGIKP